MQYNKREVIYAILHTAITYPGFGGLPKTLAVGSNTPNSANVSKMTIVDQFVEANIAKGVVKRTVLIPLTGFELLVLGDEKKVETVTVNTKTGETTVLGGPNSKTLSTATTNA